ncbi:MAG: HDOD domain-containing protein [Candidatus Electryonea clarkiae]|nr:HDOD domain-containing protein [Candidatus Electryonea clarkiae]MDP8286034.1 HDOD domain-containing protein [Candidatus Electryonea clarkiae]
MSNERKDEIFAKIARIGDLPTLPEVALNVSRLVDDPASNISDIVHVIRNDPSLTSKILKIANSAFYGMRRRIESLNMALVILGMREISSLVTAICVFKAFPQNNLGVKFDYHQFWLHSTGVGEVAKLMGRRLGFREVSGLFTGGLLHDLGKIIEAKYFLDEFVECLRLSAEENIPLHEAEVRILGVDHAEIGAWLAEQWGLPLFLNNIIKYHHNVEAATSNKSEVALINISNSFCKTTDYGFGGDNVQVSIKDNPAWDILISNKADAVSFDLEKFMVDMESEIQHAKEFLVMTS